MQNLAVEEPERGRLQTGGARVQLALIQIQLVLPNLDRAELIGRAVKIRSELPDGGDVDTCGSLGVITSLEFLERPFSKMGHRDLLVTHTIWQRRRPLPSP